MELRRWVRWARGEAKMTQPQLGDILGCTKGNISQWETGGHQPSFDQIVKIAGVARVPLPHEVDDEGRPQQMSRPALQMAQTYDRLPDGKEKLDVLARILGMLSEVHEAMLLQRAEPAYRPSRAPEPTAASLLVGDQLFVDAVKHAARQVLEMKEARRARGRRVAAAPKANTPAAPKPNPKR
jgi:transcriptional regulator with XRE-family HTH domain